MGLARLVTPRRWSLHRPLFLVFLLAALCACALVLLPGSLPSVTLNNQQERMFDIYPAAHDSKSLNVSPPPAAILSESVSNERKGPQEPVLPEKKDENVHREEYDPWEVEKKLDAGEKEAPEVGEANGEEENGELEGAGDELVEEEGVIGGEGVADSREQKEGRGLGHTAPTPTGYTNITNTTDVVAPYVPQISPEANITLVILGYYSERAPNLHRAINFYRRVPLIRRVVLIWNGDKNVTFEWQPVKKGFQAPVDVLYGPTNTLSNRYNPYLVAPHTDAVLLADDDVIIPLLVLRCLYAMWRESPHRLVSSTHTRSYVNGIYVFQPPNSTFNLVMPGHGMLLHRKYLDMYFQHPQLVSYVDNHSGHCDDVAISMLVSRATNQAPRAIAAKQLIGLATRKFGVAVENTGTVGLDHQKNRWVVRTECCRWIGDYFGFNITHPLPMGRIEKPCWEVKAKKRKA